MVGGDAKAACDATEIMVSAYCTGDGATLHIADTTGASCEDGKAVIFCARK
jgi:hypothetical protein